MKKAHAHCSLPRVGHGFTLVEMAMVLVIFALLFGGMLISLSTSRDIANEKETQKQLASINEALLGYAAAQQRLPCPAAPATTGIESPPGGGACTNNFTGFVPAITLGITPTNAQGYAIDAWGNPIRYAVTNANANAFTTGSGLKAAWATGPATILPDLRACNTSNDIKNAEGINAMCDDSPDTALTNAAVAVLFSTGMNGGAAPPVGNSDELANWTTSNDRVFVNAIPSATFDDLVVWLSPNILYNRLIAAGQLP